MVLQCKVRQQECNLMLLCVLNVSRQNFLPRAADMQSPFSESLETLWCPFLHLLFCLQENCGLGEGLVMQKFSAVTEWVFFLVLGLFGFFFNFLGKVN